MISSKKKFIFSVQVQFCMASFERKSAWCLFSNRFFGMASEIWSISITLNWLLIYFDCFSKKIVVVGKELINLEPKQNVQFALAETEIGWNGSRSKRQTVGIVDGVNCEWLNLQWLKWRRTKWHVTVIPAVVNPGPPSTYEPAVIPKFQKTTLQIAGCNGIWSLTTRIDKVQTRQWIMFILNLVIGLNLLSTNQTQAFQPQIPSHRLSWISKIVFLSPKMIEIRKSCNVNPTWRSAPSKCQEGSHNITVFLRILANGGHSVRENMKECKKEPMGIQRLNLSEKHYNFFSLPLNL